MTVNDSINDIPVENDRRSRRSASVKRIEKKEGRKSKSSSLGDYYLIYHSLDLYERMER